MYICFPLINDFSTKEIKPFYFQILTSYSLLQIFDSQHLKLAVSINDRSSLVVKMLYVQKMPMNEFHISFKLIPNLLVCVLNLLKGFSYLQNLILMNKIRIVLDGYQLINKEPLEVQPWFDFLKVLALVGDNFARALFIKLFKLMM